MFDRQKLFKTNWDDIKYFLLLSRNGRLSTAAKQLGTTHATVSNRISSLEKALGVKLFIQDHKGFRQTKAGENFALYAEECEKQLYLALENSETNGNTRSKIRIGITEGLGDNYLSFHIARWIRHQNLEIDFISLPKTTSITSREADISITIDRPKGEFVIRKELTKYNLGIYASQSYLAEAPVIQSKDDLIDHIWIGYIERMLFAKALNYHKEISGDLNFAFNSTSIRAQQQAARGGLGLSILPVFLASGDERLVRVLPDVQFIRRYWISSTKDIHRFAALKLTWDFILKTCKSDSSFFSQEY